ERRRFSILELVQAAFHSFSAGSEQSPRSIRKRRLRCAPFFQRELYLGASGQDSLSWARTRLVSQGLADLWNFVLAHRVAVHRIGCSPAARSRSEELLFDFVRGPGEAARVGALLRERCSYSPSPSSLLDD